MERALEDYASLRGIERERLRDCLFYHKDLEACTIGENEKLFSHRCNDKGAKSQSYKTSVSYGLGISNWLCFQNRTYGLFLLFSK